MAKSIGANSSFLSLPTGTPSSKGLGESFSTDLYRGTGNLSIPINIPPGINGVTPDISLSYSSGQGNGSMGMGFSFPQMWIQRSMDKILPTYNDGIDTFRFGGGDKLIHMGNDRYRPQVDKSNWLIQYHKDFWTVETQDGTTYYFGENNNNRIYDPTDTSKIQTWLLSRSIDSNGIEIKYEYLEVESQRYLLSIQYAIFTLKFDYSENRPDPIKNRRAGFLIETDRLLTSLEIQSYRDKKRILRRYDFNYEQDKLRKTSYLNSMSLSAGDGDNKVIMPELTFAFSELKLKLNNPTTLNIPTSLSSLPDLDDPDISMLDLAGDGLPDIVLSNQTGTYAWQNMGNGTWAEEKNIEDLPAGHNLGDQNIRFADLEGNGTVDLIYQDTGISGYFENKSGGKWEAYNDYETPLPFELSDPNLELIDINGDGRVDAIISLPDRFEIYYNEGKSGWNTNPKLVYRVHDLDVWPDVFFSDSSIYFADMTGDGLLDIVKVSGSSVEYWPHYGHANFGKKVTMISPPQLVYDARLEDIELIDITGDGLADFIWHGQGSISIWVNCDGDSYSNGTHLDHLRHTAGKRPSLIDLFATGSRGLIYQNILGLREYQYCSLGDDISAFILTEFDNGMGSKTHISYTPVEKMRGDARRKGDDWNTFLPFPHQVVSNITVTDAFLSVKSSTDYTYSQGHYDGTEGEFRGFGLVNELEFGDKSTPSLRRNYTFDVGADIAIKEEQRRNQSDEERLKRRALSGVVLEVKVESKNHEETDFIEKESVFNNWIVEEQEPKGITSVYIPLKTETLKLSKSSSIFKASLNKSLKFDDQGNTIQEQVSVGNMVDGKFNTEESQNVFYKYANGKIHACKWCNKGLAEILVTDDKGNIIELTRRYYDGKDFIGLPLGEFGNGNLMRVEELVISNELEIPKWLSNDKLIKLGFRYENTYGWMKDSVSYSRIDDGRLTSVRDPKKQQYDLYYDISGLHVIKVDDPLGFSRKALIDKSQEAISEITNASGLKERQVFDAMGRVIHLLRTDDQGEHCYLSYIYSHALDLNINPVPSSITTLSPRTRTTFKEMQLQVTLEDHSTNDFLKTLTRFSGTGYQLEMLTSCEPNIIDDYDTIASGTKHRNAKGSISSVGWPSSRKGFKWNSANISEQQSSFEFLYDYRQRIVESSTNNTKKRITIQDPWFSERSETLTSATGEKIGGNRREEYDSYGRLKKLIEPINTNSTSVEYEYTSNGNLRNIVSNGRSLFTQIMDLTGNTIINDSPDAGRREFAYDVNGNLVFSKSSDDIFIKNTYDVHNRIVLISTKKNKNWETMREYFYDTNPNDPSIGNLTGRLALIKDEGGELSYTYNNVGDFLSITRVFKDGKSFIINYEYDSLGNLSKIEYPNGKIVEYGYDRGNLLSSINGFIDQTTYSTDGIPSLVNYSNGISCVREHDEGRQLVFESLLDKSNNFINKHKFEYDNSGNISNWQAISSGKNKEQTFNYDDSFRLTSVNNIGTSEKLEMEYDSLGNILKKKDSNTKSYFYSDKSIPNRLSSYHSENNTFTLNYDAAGRVVSHDNYGEFEYDEWGRPSRCITNAGTEIKYIFGYADELVSKIVTKSGKTRTHYYIGGIYEEVDNNSSCSVVANGQLIGSILSDKDQNNINRIFHTDLLGNVLFVSNTKGDITDSNDYETWGEFQKNTSSSAFFIGREYEDDIKVILMGTRFYDPEIGRFLSPDDLFLNRPEGFTHSLQLLNPYSYAANNPVRFRDPNGRFPVIAAIIIGAAIGAYIGYQTAKERGTDPFVGALIGGIVGGIFGASGALGAAAIGGSVSAGVNLIANDGKPGEYFWTSVAVGFAFGGVSSAIPNVSSVAGEGLWVNVQNIALEVGRGALLGGLHGAVQASVTDENAWDGFTSGALMGGAVSLGKIALQGVLYDPMSGPDPSKGDLTGSVKNQFSVDSGNDNSAIRAKISMPDTNTIQFRRGGIAPRIIGGRSFVFGNNVNMAVGQEYNVNILAHEIRHIAQIQVHSGMAGFLFEYASQYFSSTWKFAYTNTPNNTTYEVYHHH